MNKIQKGLDEFAKLCLDCSNEKMLLSLFNLFFTEEEKADLSLRYLIINALLKKDKVQRDIAKSLNVSIAKVTRGSNELKRIDNKLLSYLLKNHINR